MFRCGTGVLQILSCHSLPTDSLLASGGNDNSSEQNLPLSSVSYVPLAQAVPNQVKRHGRKAQDESEAPQRRGRNASAEAPLRRGRKASASSTAVLSGSGSQELKSTEPPQKKSIVSSGRATVTTRSKQENETDLDVSVSDGILLTKVEACESTLDPAAIAGLVGDIGNHSNVEVTFEVEQILEEPSDQQCRTQEFEASEKVEFLNEQHQTQMEVVLEPSEIGKEMSGETTCDGVEQGDQVLLDNVEVDWSLEEPSVQQCQTRLEKDVKASRIIVLSSEHHQTRAEESTERTEQGDKILCDDVEVPVKVCHSLEEPSVKQCQTPIERVFEPSKNLEDFEEAAKHEAIEKQGGEASLSVEETEAESCQTLEELPGKHSRSEVEDIQTEETNAGRSNDVKEVTQNVEMDSRTNLIVDSGEENEPKLRI